MLRRSALAYMILQHCVCCGHGLRQFPPFSMALILSRLYTCSLSRTAVAFCIVEARRSKALPPHCPQMCLARSCPAQLCAGQAADLSRHTLSVWLLCSFLGSISSLIIVEQTLSHELHGGQMKDEDVLS